jgi:hypothetical protein
MMQTTHYRVNIFAAFFSVVFTSALYSQSVISNFQVNDNLPLNFDQSEQAIAVDFNGDIVIVWVDERRNRSAWRLYLQRITSGLKCLRVYKWGVLL